MNASLEVQWYSSLVMLAVSRPEKALEWLLSQLPRYFFWEIYGNEQEGLALVT